MAINDGTSLRNNTANGQMISSSTPQTEETNPVRHTAAYKGRDEVAYNLSKKYFNTPRRVKIVVAGAGCSGLDLAHAVESGVLKNVELQIYEKNAGLGGTWYENRYPGCACDIPSHNYMVRIDIG